MGIKLEIELEALANPAVARALSQLLLALGNESPASTGDVVSEPSPAQADQPEVVPAPSAPVTPPPVKKAAAPAARPSPAPKAAAPAPKVAESGPNGKDLSIHERYRSFYEQLPERSRRFLDLVREHGTLTIDDAMQALDIKVPKAMGGITGSIGRWAPVRRVPIPYEAIETSDGRRAWRWVGVDEGERAPSKPPRASKPASASAARSSSAAKPAAAKPAAAKAPARPDASGNGFDRFLADLPSRSRQFVQLLRERGRLTISEVREEFKLARAKAVGGIIEPVKRIALDHGIWPVYDSETTEDGERVWIWLSPAK